MELTKEKQDFWDTLRLPVEKNCSNCKHGKNPVCWERWRCSDEPNGHRNSYDNRIYIKELGLDETRKDEWKWMWEWNGEK